ncbi:MAG: tripartite tricarboxylate transporter TctB family protein [Candidatus Competibacterales bacterium]|nr:tripartite tricarboxylate transporter TctB family protein [Candidatus Competibacterales bacterium]
MGDRIVGVGLFLLAVAYGLQARTYTSGFLTDPLGPTAFPQLLAVLLGLGSIYLIVRPDPDVDWPRGRALLHQLFTVGVLVAYAFVLEPLGFIPVTFVALTVIALQFDVRLLPAAVMGALASGGLFLLFDLLLGLPLPMGTVYGG